MDYYQNNTSYYQTQQPAYNVNLPGYKPEEPAEQAPQVSSLARRIHGWSWQAVRGHLYSVRSPALTFSSASSPLEWAREPSS